MSDNPKSLINYIETSVKLPRQNGEIIFQNPWETRVFAMAVLLFQKGNYQWKSFIDEFVKEIGKFESQHPDEDIVSTYYQHWSQAFERLLISKEMLNENQLKARIVEFETGQRNHVC